MSKKKKYIFHKWSLWAYRGVSGVFYPLSTYSNIEGVHNGKQPIPKNEYPLIGYHEWKLTSISDND